MKRFQAFAVLALALLLLPIAASAAARHLSLVTSLESAMPISLQRQLIVDEFKRRLAKIDSSASPLANGYQYQTDIGKNSIDEWATVYQQEELQAAKGQARISVFDLVRTRKKDFPDEVSIEATLPMQVRTYHWRGLTPADVRKQLADIQQAVVTDPDTGRRDLTLGGLATDINPTDDGFIIPKEVFTIEGAAVGFEVETVIEPYGQ
jgi:hypothetical protein